LAEWLNLPSNPVALGLSFAAFVFAQALRQYCRTALLIESRVDAVAKMDFTFVLVTMLGSIGLLLMSEITTPTIFFLLAISNGAASAAFSSTLWRSAGQGVHRDKYLEDIKVLWSLSRWAVIGSVVGWLGNNSYLYFSGAIVGVAALADLNAARLLLMPIVIVGTAWVTLALPAMGYMIASSEGLKIRSFVMKSTLVMEVFTLVYVGALFAVFPWLTTYVFGGKYSDISYLILLWGCYFAVYTARNVGTVLLTSYGAFRALFWQGVLSLIILLAATLGLTPLFGVAGALSAMILVELWELAVNYGYMLPRARRQHLGLK
jgi:O-antigen/teichoic acid export membrane protein